MLKHLPLLAALALVLVAPIVLRPKTERRAIAGERVLVVITPHNEAIRYEFGRGFARWYAAKTGARVRIDYRTPGGTSEITRWIAGEYVAAFESYWVHSLGKTWSSAVERAFANPKVKPGDAPASDMPAEAARRAFLSSVTSCKLDVIFGGGVFDFQQLAAAGYLVDSGFVQEHPELFGPEGAIPQTVSGEHFWEKEGRWIGNVVSAFGIVSNTDTLRRLRISQVPQRWEDLAKPGYARQLALANPTQSSSVNKSFEMLIQQQMQLEMADRRALPGTPALTPDQEKEALAAGWTRGIRLLQRIGANARYFTDVSTKIALDVAAGDSAAGMTIDFYGRFQSEAVARPDGASFVQYVNAIGGTSVGVDPIGVFRGAPNPGLAREFIAFVMSPDGQKLWNWKIGTPEGPERYALRRLPVLPALYADEFKALRTDPEVQPYELAKTFTYREAWTNPLFRSIAFIFRVMCIDPHDELTAAWHALIAADFPPEATAEFSNVAAVDYAAASGRIREVFGPVKIREVQLARELADQFREQYRRAEQLARAGR